MNHERRDAQSAEPAAVQIRCRRRGVIRDAQPGATRTLTFTGTDATGVVWTREAAVKLLRQIGADIVAACFVIDLPDLGGRQKLEALGVPVRTLIGFEGH